MRENWNRLAQRVLAMARDEASRSQRPQVGTEHILLALCRLEEGAAPKVLARHCATLDRVRKEVDRLRHAVKGRAAASDLTFSPHAQAVMHQAEVEAERISFGEVGPVHLLLGIAQHEECAAARILTGLDVILTDLWVEVVSQIAESETRKRSNPTPPPLPGIREKDGKLAQAIVRRATDMARSMRAAAVGTEHLLLAIAAEEWGIPAMLLRDLGLDEPRIRAEVERFSTPSRDGALQGEVPLAKHTRLVWNYAMREAESLGHATVRGEHLFLGLLRDERGFAAGVLRSLSLDLDEARERLLCLMCPEPQGV